MNSIKKVVAGTLIVCTTLSSYNLIGAVSKEIKASVTDFKLFINGSKVDKEIVAVNGSSYLPVRALSEALGLDVNWDSSTGTIKLTNAKPSSSGNEAVLKETLDSLQKKNDELTKENADLKSQLAVFKGEIPTGQGEIVKPLITTGNFIESYTNNWNKQTSFMINKKAYTENVLGYKFLHELGYTEDNGTHFNKDDDKVIGQVVYTIKNTEYKYKKLTFSFANDDLNSQKEVFMAAYRTGVKGKETVPVQIEGKNGGIFLPDGCTYTKDGNGIYTVEIDLVGYSEVEIRFAASKMTAPTFLLTFPMYIK